MRILPRRLKLGYLNVRGCNQEEKKGEIVAIFDKRNLDVLGKGLESEVSEDKSEKRGGFF